MNEYRIYLRNRLDLIETAIKQHKELLETLRVLDLLSATPESISPKTVYFESTEKNITINTHNILGWILGMLYNEKGKTEKLWR